MLGLAYSCRGWSVVLGLAYRCTGQSYMLGQPGRKAWCWHRCFTSCFASREQDSLHGLLVSNKATPPNPSQAFPLTKNQAFKYMSLGGSFSLKPAQCLTPGTPASLESTLTSSHPNKERKAEATWMKSCAAYPGHHSSTSCLLLLSTFYTLYRTLHKGGSP